MLSEDATARLVAQSLSGEPDAFDALVRAFLRAAYSVALAVVGRPADAQDIAQDAFVLAFERLESCREPRRFGGWLLQIVRNQARNWLERRTLRDVPAHEESDGSPAQTPSPDAHLLEAPLLAALEKLSPVRREVVLLHDLEEWTHAEIASCLGISETMSRQHLFQARQQLRAQLRDRPVTEG